MVGFVKKYKEIVPNPAVHSGLVGLGTGGLTYAAWNPLVDTVFSLARPMVALGNGGSLPADFYESYAKAKNSKKWRILASLGMGLAGTALTAATMYRGNERNGGLFDWDAPADRSQLTYSAKDTGDITMPGRFEKAASAAGMLKRAYIDYMADPDGAFDMDYGTRINMHDADMMFTNDPTVANNNYVRNFGRSIVNDAAIRSGTYNPTLGAVKDAAQDKFETKFSFANPIGAAAKTVLANQASRLFTDALGAVVNLPDRARDNIVSAGTWGAAITSIVNIGD